MYGFYLPRAPNLGKITLCLSCFPMSSANLQDSINPKPLMVGIAEEPPRHHQIDKISSLNQLKSLIFGESTENTPIYTLTEAIYISPSFA